MLAVALISGVGSHDGSPANGGNRLVPDLALPPLPPRIPHGGHGLRYVAPGGSDTASGSRRHPWRTIQRAAHRARPGMTIVLRRGMYGRRGTYVEIANCEVRNNYEHAGIYLDGAEHVRIIGNHVHHNGNFATPATANLDHGIYFGDGSGVIANNVIEDNYAFGVQLYPKPHDVLVTHNTIVRNGRSGVIVANDAADNEIVNNIIADNAQNAVRGFALSGSTNLVDNNLFWANADAPVGPYGGDRLMLAANRSADPRFRGRNDYRLRPGSPALGLGSRKGRVHTDYRGRARPRRGPADLGTLEAR